MKNLNLYINVQKVRVFQRRNSVSLSALNQRRNLTLKQRWFCVDSKKQTCSYTMMLENFKFLCNVEMITVFQRRNNVSLSTLNEHRNLTLKQLWFCVDFKKQICSYIMMLEKLKSLCHVEKITVFQRGNNVSLSTLNQRRN